MEVMSDSITGDFQTRRLNIKYKDATGNRNLAYTINNTGATHRLLIAILDHYQQEDGSVKVPKALHPYLNKTVLGKNA
jgi:seryl-tRNA synthetase